MKNANDTAKLKAVTRTVNAVAETRIHLRTGEHWNGDQYAVEARAEGGTGWTCIGDTLDDAGTLIDGLFNEGFLTYGEFVDIIERM